MSINNYTPKINDIVRISIDNKNKYKDEHKIKLLSINLFIKFIDEKSMLGEDMYGNTILFYDEQIIKVIFESSSQTTIQDFLYNNEIQLIKNNIADLEKKLSDSFRTPQSIKNLKLLRNKELEKLKQLELKNKDDFIPIKTYQKTLSFL